MGATSYKETLAMGGTGDNNTPTYVVTHDKNLKAGKNVHMYSGDLRGLIEKIKSEIDENKDIYIWGGGDIVTQLVDQDQLDELIIAIAPVLLGSGVPLFGKLHEWKKLELVGSNQFKSGIILLKYRPKTL